MVVVNRTVAGWPGTVKGRPWTVSHFRRWTEQMIFEDGQRHAPEAWQLEVFADLCRGFQEVWLIVPEGNSKTSFISEVCLYHLDNTQAPWVPIGASSRDQAEILFGQADGFLDRTAACRCDPPIIVDCRCDRCGAPTLRFDKWENPTGPFKMAGTRQLRHVHNGGRGLKVYASDVETADGVIPTLFSIDEGHRVKDLGQYRTWVGKCEKRGGQGLMISTAGVPGSDFEKTRELLRQHATDIKRKGRCYGRFATRDEAVLHEFAIPSVGHARDIEIVKEANPLKKISKASLKAKLNRPSLDFGEDWLRKTCNVPARSSKAAVAELDWERAGRAYDGDPEDAIEGRHLRIPEGVPVLVGADYAWVLDTTALTPLWLAGPQFRLLGQTRVLLPPRDGSMLDPIAVQVAFTKINERNPIIAIIGDMTKAQDTMAWAGQRFGCPVVDRTQANEHACEDYEAYMEALRGGRPLDDEGPERTPWLRHDSDVGTLAYDSTSGSWEGAGMLREHVMNAIARKLPGDRYRFDRQTASRAASQQDERVIDALTASGMVNRTAAAGWIEPERTAMVAVVAR